jgi:hypothetical protein
MKTEMTLYNYSVQFSNSNLPNSKSSNCNFSGDQYIFLKKSIAQFKKDLENFRVLMPLIPTDTALELMAEIVAIKENVGEVLEKEFLKINF